MPNKNYCIVTGASEGFGKALALECASRKMNLVLVALPGPELFYLAEHIKYHYQVDVITIEKDLAIEENCNMVFKQIMDLGLRVNILINNAGLGSTMLFSEGTMAFFERQIKLNVIATTYLTRLFLDTLKTNGPSHILNVGSLGSYFFLEKKQVYSATKSFIYSFSKSLRSELRGDGINVTVICPGSMKTNATVIQLQESSGWINRLSVMTPEDVASIAIDGLLNHREVIIPGRLNKLFLLVDKLLPAPIKKTIIRRQMKKTRSVTASEIKQKEILHSESRSQL